MTAQNIITIGEIIHDTSPNNFFRILGSEVLVDNHIAINASDKAGSFISPIFFEPIQNTKLPEGW